MSGEEGRPHSLEFNCGRAEDIQTYFEFGDKPHKLLARQLRKRESDRAIHRVKSEEGTPLTSHRHINDMFRRFYDDLYNSKAMRNLKLRISS
ncbi:hypothetical protein F7725_020303 [Dissostichus mawsoni]|uniref:Uncharacterized protein n=1 Tax=Dissostichus mawsoni TaxID=36200 RepID=A0A7J5YCX8_DISMA|nr:hypothetical protein F7725_020303 [Dissostichus mawsoni]